jgi:hypothetical protein
MKHIFRYIDWAASDSADGCFRGLVFAASITVVPVSILVAFSLILKVFGIDIK